jgi:hypothetical protein
MMEWKNVIKQNEDIAFCVELKQYVPLYERLNQMLVYKMFNREMRGVLFQ